LLAAYQEEGALGCFLLTEKQAGVLSGLIVETTADWDAASQTFILHTPRDASAKNWISQGCVRSSPLLSSPLRAPPLYARAHAYARTRAVTRQSSAW
jgi:acyl-CoA oxidase